MDIFGRFLAICSVEMDIREFEWMKNTLDLYKNFDFIQIIKLGKAFSFRLEPPTPYNQEQKHRNKLFICQNFQTLILFNEKCISSHKFILFFALDVTGWLDLGRRFYLDHLCPVDCMMVDFGSEIPVNVENQVGIVVVSDGIVLVVSFQYS